MEREALAAVMMLMPGLALLMRWPSPVMEMLTPSERSHRPNLSQSALSV